MLPSSTSVWNQRLLFSSFHTLAQSVLNCCNSQTRLGGFEPVKSHLYAQDAFKIPVLKSVQNAQHLKYNWNVQHLKYNWNVQHLKESWTMNIHWTLNDCTDCSVWQSQRKLRGFEAEQLKSHTADYWLGFAKFPGFTGFPGFPGFAECLGFSVFPGFPGY